MQKISRMESDEQVSAAGLRIVAVLNAFPPLEQIDGGELIRPYELLTGMSRLGATVQVLATRPGREDRFDFVRSLPGSSGRRLVRFTANALGVAGWLRKQGAEAKKKDEKLVLYRKVPADLGMHFGRVPIPSDPSWRMDRVIAELGGVVWNTMHDLAPDHAQTVVERMRRAGTMNRADYVRTRQQSVWEERLQRRALWQPGICTVVSEGMRDLLRERYFLSSQSVHVLRSGINPALVGEIPQWQPPTGNKPWVFGFLGSANDACLPEVISALQGVTGVKLVLAGRGMEKIPIAENSNVTVLGSFGYAHFADFARTVDAWVIHYGDDPYLDMAWQLKPPMYLASGRPVLMTDTRELGRSGVRPHVWPMGTTPMHLRETLMAMKASPDEAQRRAQKGARLVTAKHTWEARLRAFLPFLRSHL